MIKRFVGQKNFVSPGQGAEYTARPHHTKPRQLPRHVILHWSLELSCVGRHLRTLLRPALTEVPNRADDILAQSILRDNTSASVRIPN